VVGGEDEEDRVGLPRHDPLRGGGDRGRGVAGSRFEEKLARLPISSSAAAIM
jgi:hypothetical protein